jgi:hypothetical protein
MNIIMGLQLKLYFALLGKHHEISGSGMTMGVGTFIDILAEYQRREGLKPEGDLFANLGFKVSSPTIQICHAVQSQ